MKARFCASELAGIEPTPPAPKGAGYVRLDHSGTGFQLDVAVGGVGAFPRAHASAADGECADSQLVAELHQGAGLVSEESKHHVAGDPQFLVV